MFRTKTGDKVGTAIETYATTLYEKMDALLEALDQLLCEGELLDYPELNDSIRELLNDTEDWMEEHSPSEDEIESRKILKSMWQ